VILRLLSIALCCGLLLSPAARAEQEAARTYLAAGSAEVSEACPLAQAREKATDEALRQALIQAVSQSIGARRLEGSLTLMAGSILGNPALLVQGFQIKASTQAGGRLFILIEAEVGPAALKAALAQAGVGLSLKTTVLPLIKIQLDSGPVFAWWLNPEGPAPDSLTLNTLLARLSQLGLSVVSPPAGTSPPPAPAPGSAEAPSPAAITPPPAQAPSPTEASSPAAGPAPASGETQEPPPTPIAPDPADLARQFGADLVLSGRIFETQAAEGRLASAEIRIIDISSGRVVAGPVTVGRPPAEEAPPPPPETPQPETGTEASQPPPEAPQPATEAEASQPPPAPPAAPEEAPRVEPSPPAGPEQVDAVEAGERLAGLLVNDLKLAGWALASNPIPAQIQVDGIKRYADLKVFLDALARLPELIQDVKQQSIRAGQAWFDVKLLTTAQRLADLLVAQDYPTFFVSPLEVEPNRIRLKLIQK